MRAFEYSTPTTKEQAVQALSSTWGETEVLAGGTDLLSLMKEYLSSPKRLVDIKRIKELGGIGSRQGGLRIGALVTFEELVNNSTVKQQYPSLATAALGVTSPQVRARGTVGGDLCQRPRCWYYRNGFGLLARGEDGNPLVPDGENEFHAIFGGGPAYFVSASSLGPALAALDAKVGIFGPSGARQVSASEFFVAPKSNNERENVLKPNEIVTEVVIPGGARRNATYEVRQKTALDWPLVTASVALTMNGRSVKSSHVVLGHVAPTPWAASDAEEVINGKSITEEIAAKAGEAAASRAQPLSKNAYKVQLVRVSVKRALMAAART